MIAWMLYTIIISTLIAAAASSLEWLGRATRHPVRWIWLGAMALTIALAVAAPLRARSHSDAVALSTLPRVVGTALTTDAPTWRQILMITLRDTDQRLRAGMNATLTEAQRAAPRSATKWIIVYWSLVTMSIALIFQAVQRRVRRSSRRWPVADVQGVRVRVSPQVGPVVIGLRAPEIVVPAWLLSRTAEEQRLVVAHEVEHVRAHDSLLLGAGCAAAALMPWNPALWFLLSRLRLAIELDCDARVIRAGAAPHRYGSLLIDVAENASALRLGALALADGSSHLRQRILAMKVSAPRFAIARGALLAALGSATLLIACQAGLPTDADVAHLDATSAEKSARELALIKAADSVKFFVDGVAVAAERARSVPREDIDGVEVVKATGGGGEIHIRTKMKAAAARADSAMVGIAKERDSGRAVLCSECNVTERGPGTEQIFVGRGRLEYDKSGPPFASFNGLIYIDGTRSTTDALKALNPNGIESIEVLKGPRAAEVYSDPAAVNGVIIVKTKKAP